MLILVVMNLQVAFIVSFQVIFIQYNCYIYIMNLVVSDLKVYFHVMSLPVTTPLPGSVLVTMDLLYGHYKQVRPNVYILERSPLIVHSLSMEQPHCIGHPESSG